MRTWWMVILIAGALSAAGCGDGCDAEATCRNKTDRALTKILPLCGVEPSHDGPLYTWKTETGSCECFLETTAALSFWRGCTFTP